MAQVLRSQKSLGHRADDWNAAIGSFYIVDVESRWHQRAWICDSVFYANDNWVNKKMPQESGRAAWNTVRECRYNAQGQRSHNRSQLLTWKRGALRQDGKRKIPVIWLIKRTRFPEGWLVGVHAKMGLYPDERFWSGVFDALRFFSARMLGGAD
ncbi:MAG: hypothetical protein J0L73_27830 [Verrucomicrobia bacterium]|nr:hypothetical protein [Verrucomicrobiota bacterium]